MSRPPHPLTMIGKRGHRDLADGCTACQRSKVFCDCVKHIEHDGIGCCRDCSHNLKK